MLLELLFVCVDETQLYIAARNLEKRIKKIVSLAAEPPSQSSSKVLMEAVKQKMYFRLLLLPTYFAAVSISND